MKHILTFWILITGIITLNAQEESGMPRIFSLEECLKTARTNNTQIRYSKANINSADADLTNAFGNFLPSFSANARYTRYLSNQKQYATSGTVLHGNFYPNQYSASIGFNYPIFDGFSRQANYKRAQNTYESTLLDVSFTEQQVILDIYNNYVDVIKNKQIVKIREENLTTGKKDLEKMKAEYDAGTKSLGDVYAQEAELGNRELDLVQAKNTLDLSKATLLTNMGLKADLDADFLESSLPNEISEQRIKQFRSDIGTFDEALKEAMKKRTDHRSLDLKIKAEEANVTSAESGYYPQLSASGGWGWNNVELNNFGQLGVTSVGLSLNVPIFENFNTQYQIQSSKARVLQKQIELVDNEQKIRSEMMQRFLNLDAAEKELDITGRALKSAQLNFESAKERYDIGVFNITDYLNANYQLINSKINRVNAVYNYYNAQRAMLFTIGRL